MELLLISCAYLCVIVLLCVCACLAVAWHPVHESLFASGGSDGAILFWMVG